MPMNGLLDEPTTIEGGGEHALVPHSVRRDLCHTEFVAHVAGAPGGDGEA
jgi:hypothetical protein